jgi:hypothetical protein
VPISNFWYVISVIRCFPHASRLDKNARLVPV